MKKIFIPAIFLSVVLLSGCFAPVTQTYDSARMVKEGEVEIKANYSFYENPTYNDLSDDFIKNRNFGISAVYGTDNKTNLGLRYEYIDNQRVPIDSVNVNSSFIQRIIDLYKESDIHFVEFDSKFSLKQDKIAFSAPIAMYRFQKGGGTLFELRPRFYFTFANKRNTFDLSIIPQGKFLIGGGSIGPLIPSLGLGMGFSSDLDKWAIRPEISYDYWTFAIGVSGSYRFPLRKK